MYGEPDAVSISLVPSISLSKYLYNSLLQSKYLEILPLQSKKSKNKSKFLDFPIDIRLTIHII